MIIYQNYKTTIHGDGRDTVAVQEGWGGVKKKSLGKTVVKNGNSPPRGILVRKTQKNVNLGVPGGFAHEDGKAP